MTLPARISDRIANSNREIDARVRALAERIRSEQPEHVRDGRPRLDESYNAMELSPAARERLGFPPDWTTTAEPIIDRKESRACVASWRYDE